MYIKSILGGLMMGLLSTQAAAEVVSVEVDNIHVEKGGNVMVLMFTDEGFPIKHERAVQVETKPADQARLSFEFAKPDAEFVAFKVLHDEDQNNKVTKNWTGIWPAEGLGFSNDKSMGAFGPPDFEEARLSPRAVDAPVSLKVTYP